MAKGIVKKHYNPSGGVDLKSSDIVRDENHLSGGENCRYGSNFGFRKRFGFGKRTADTDLLGPIYEYNYINRFGEQKKELVGFDTNGRPQKLVEGFFTISNNSVADGILSFYYYEPSTEFRFRITHVGGTTSLDVGVGEPGQTTVNSLITVLNGVLNFSCAISPDDAAYGDALAGNVEILEDEILPPGEDRQVKFHYWQDINIPAGGVVYVENGLNKERFSLAKPTTVHDVMYIPTATLSGEKATTQEKRICKYDGQTYYRAGVPEGPRVYGGYDRWAGAGGNVWDCRGQWVTSGTPDLERGVYRLQLNCHDNVGNIIKGRISPHGVNAGTGAGKYFFGLYVRFDDDELSIPPTERDEEKTGHLYRKSRIEDRGFYDHCGLARLVFTNTLTVTLSKTGSSQGHTLKAGDVVRFFDTNQDKFIWRKVESTSGTYSVTLSGDAIDDTEDNGGAISCYLDAVFSTMTATVWRAYQNVLNHTPLYFIDEIPVDCFTQLFNGSTTTFGDPANGILLYVDQRGDDGLQEEATLDFPQYTPGPAPECNFLASYNGLLVGSGDGKNPSTVYFEDIVDLESFPLSTHSFLAKAGCLGLGQSGPALAVFTEDASQVVYGDLSSFNFRVETLTENIGCISPNSIHEIDEGIITFLSKRGVYVLSGGRNLAPLGAFKDGKSSILEPLFTAEYPRKVDGVAVSYPHFEASLGAVDGVRKLFYLHIPWPTDSEDVDKRNLGGPLSETWVFDYGVGAWLPVWTDLDFSTGMAMYKGVLWGSQRSKIPPSGIVYGRAFKQVVDKGIYNYGDHEYTIGSAIRTHHESLGDPNLYKKYIRAAIGAFSECDSSSWILEVRAYPNYDYSTVMTEAIATATNGSITRVKLKSGKANSLMLEFANSNRYEDFLITGWDLSIKTPYGKPSSAFRGDD